MKQQVNKRRPTTLRRSILWGGLGLSLAMLTACAQNSGGASVDKAASQVVQGDVVWNASAPLPPGAELKIRLSDTSRADAPSITLAEQRVPLRPDQQGPVPFRLAVDPARIDQRMQYTVSARIDAHGQLLYISDTVTPVLTRGAGNNVQVALVPARP